MTLSDDVRVVALTLGLSLVFACLGVSYISGNGVLQAQARTMLPDPSLKIPALPMLVAHRPLHLNRDPFRAQFIAGQTSDFADQMALPANSGAQWTPFQVSNGPRVLAVLTGIHSRALVDDAGRLITVVLGDQLRGRVVIKITNTGVVMDDGTMIPIVTGGQ